MTSQTILVGSVDATYIPQFQFSVKLCGYGTPNGTRTEIVSVGTRAGNRFNATPFPLYEDTTMQPDALWLACSPTTGEFYMYNSGRGDLDADVCGGATQAGDAAWYFVRQAQTPAMSLCSVKLKQVNGSGAYLTVASGYPAMVNSVAAATTFTLYRTI